MCFLASFPHFENSYLGKLACGSLQEHCRGTPAVNSRHSNTVNLILGTHKKRPPILCSGLDPRLQQIKPEIPNPRSQPKNKIPLMPPWQGPPRPHPPSPRSIQEPKCEGLKPQVGLHLEALCKNIPIMIATWRFLEGLQGYMRHCLNS